MIGIRDKLQWYLSHHPVVNPHKNDPRKSQKRLCSAAAKYQGAALNDKLLSGPELLQSLIGNFFQEHEIAISANIYAMFRQVAAPSDDSRVVVSLARRSRAEDRSLRVYGTRFRGEELADLCKLGFASTGKR